MDVNFTIKIMNHKAGIGKLIKNILFSLCLISMFYCFFPKNSTFAQELSEIQVKCAYLLNFPKYIQWEEEYKLTQFVIGFYGDEPTMYEELTNLSKNKKIKERPIKIIKVLPLNNAQNIQILYISKNEIKNIRKIASIYSHNNTLIITNDCDDRSLIMINFITTEEGIIRFEVNKPNIVFEKLKISGKILLLGGTELDLAELYRNMEDELYTSKNTIKEQQGILDEMYNKIEIQNHLISERETQLSFIQEKYSGISDSMQGLAEEFVSKKNLLNSKEQELEVLNSKIFVYNKRLNQQQEKIKESDEEIEIKEKNIHYQSKRLEEQIKQLNRHKRNEEEQVANNQKQYFINILIAIVFIGLLIVLSLYFITYNKQKKTNKLISQQNIKLIMTSGELIKTKNAAETANRAKTDFLSNMSHELRTPLNAILGYSQMLQKDKNLTEKQVKNLSTVYSSGSHLLSLINDILDFGKIEAGKVEIYNKDFNLNSLLRTVYNISLLKAEEKELYLKFEPFPQIPEYVNGDEKRLKQILINLLSNAIKYTHQGGIIFRAGYLHSTTEKFRAEIEDTGEGIEIDKHQEIFEAFTQISAQKNYIEGTGLGLPITKQLVELMNGKISLKSEPGKGSVFIVDIPLPVISEKHTDSLSIDYQITGYKGKKKTVLIIDDNTANLSVLADLLESTGFIIFTAQNGKDGIKKMELVKPDLVLLDFVMPEVDGLDTINMIREIELLENIKIIGISATISGQERYREFLQKCNDFIQKPIDSYLLFDSMKKLLTLHWETEKITDFSNKENAQITKKKIIFPPDNITDGIIEYSKMGAFTKIEQIINNLKDKGEYDIFCEKIINFIDVFDDDGIINLINKKN